ncbi:unnamed protein product [Porites evermanni]|uniref:ADF-H domain-containing protein n=1 Tax=Porites evermanni TaxID=104178 RepID=A0ABN8T476_9CNID|nr:unnamed protein product [Porites evermanni]
MSGVQVDAEINGLFNDMKMRSTHKFALFNIEGKKKIVADVCGNPCKTETKEEDEAQFNRMKEQLTNEPRYILYDFGFMKKDGRRVNKLAFIFWCDENAKIGDKMIYASSKDTIKKSFTGLSLEFQANDEGDLDYKTLSEEVEKRAS